MLNLMAWVEIHRQKLLLGAAAVLVVVGSIYLWRHFRAEREAAANTALLELGRRTGEAEAEPKAADYLKVAEQHASTEAAVRARLLAAGALFADGQFAEARAEFERVAAVTSGTLLAQAAFGIAASLDGAGQTDAAVAKYQEVISQFPAESVAGLARLKLSGIQEARNQPEAALRLYDEILRDREPGAFAQQANQGREDLLRRHPELAATNAPTAVVMP